MPWTGLEDSAAQDFGGFSRLFLGGNELLPQGKKTNLYQPPVGLDCKPAEGRDLYTYININMLFSSEPLCSPLPIVDEVINPQILGSAAEDLSFELANHGSKPVDAAHRSPDKAAWLQKKEG